MRLHDLRHFAGTMTAQVANLVETMDRLGHSAPNASLRYQSQVTGRAAESPKHCQCSPSVHPTCQALTTQPPRLASDVGVAG